jgi:Uma2 family endonuclease
MVTAAEPRMTAAELERLGAAGERKELIDGLLREKPGMSQRHGEIEVRILSPLHVFVDANGLGRVYPSDTQFKLFRDPEIIRIPDVAFVRADRLPEESERWHIAPFAPDLVVEVVSPNDSFEDVTEEIEQYQRAGVPLIWLVQPRRRAVEVFVLGQPPRLLLEGDLLDGGDVVPGFTLPVAEIFR